jgi:hypothetical protein
MLRAKPLIFPEDLYSIFEFDDIHPRGLRVFLPNNDAISGLKKMKIHIQLHH